MWLASPIREVIASELRHMHRPEIADIVLKAEFAISRRILLVDPGPLMRAELRGHSDQVFLEEWIGLTAWRAGLAIDTAIVFPAENRTPWQVNYLVDHGPAERPEPSVLQPERRSASCGSGFCSQP